VHWDLPEDREAGEVRTDAILGPTYTCTCTCILAHILYTDTVCM